VLATTSGEVGELVVGTLVGGGGFVAITRAVVQSYAKRQTEKRDSQSIYVRLYGKPANPRTNEPEQIGWTQTVDDRINALVTTTGEIKDAIETFAEAAGVEVKAQVKERARVQRRDTAK
jgi:ABC-type glycerol-3-phosphate transport system substrate-binding protein